MNKKFSTLVGGLALLGSLTAGAQGLDYSQLKTNFAEAAAVAKLPVSGNGLYQLGNGTYDGTYKDSVVYMEADGVLRFVPTPAASDSLANTLWCITISDEQQGQDPKFNFMNKGTGQRLDITMSGLEGLEEMKLSTDSMVVGGEVYGWAFSKVYKDDLDEAKPLYSRFTANGDSVVGLGVKEGGSGLYALKTAANKIDDALAAGLLQKFTIRTAAEIVLSAKQINEKLGLQKGDAGVNLTFTPNVTKNNPFNDKDNKFFAQQVTTQSAAGDSLNYVYIVKPDSTFLRVDTSYANTTGHGYLAYKWTNLEKSKLGSNASALDSMKHAAWKAQHQFLFTYRPSEDSVKIYVNRATFLKDKGTDWQKDTVGYANAHVFAQDLETAMVLTVDSAKQNVKISLGYAGCGEVESNKTSVKSGLYIIKNAKEEVLAAPIHHNGNIIQWVKLDDQMPEHMPAYQWVITQNQEALPKSSTIKMINREFADEAAAVAASIQLMTKDGAIVTEATDFNNLLKAGGLTFVQIEDSAIIKNEYLGYKHVKTADLDVTRFKFNYLHGFNHNKWVGLSNSKDSVLYAQDDYSAFTLEAGRDSVYGINVTADLLKKIPGLAQLRRSHYIVYTGGKSLTETTDDKYAVGAVSPVDTFYFKENNHYDGKDYYAIVRNNGYCQIADDAKKVGVADDGTSTPLKVQVLGETRTSAFTVEEIDAPLYRRFAYDAEGLIEGTDTLRFIEQYRGEMLQIEGNANFKVAGVNFLGINDESKAPSGLAFIVDTAWVNRGLGYIKPQYLISIDRDDIKGTAGAPCTEPGPHLDKDGNITDDPALCIHGTQGTPDMRFGKYLVNFADSVALDKEIGTTKKGYNWKEYDRAGFVNAIQYRDSLYILKGEFAGVTKKDVNPTLLAKIIKANDALVKAGKAQDSYIVNLTTDAHKYVTWSMRYTKPGTSNKTFLIESMTGTKNAKDIAPEYAAWLKMQNGCLVLSDSKTSTFNQMTGGDDALIFDVKRVADDEIATKNETITNSSVAVVAGEGNVTVTGAAGKKIVITNILGQAIETVVAASDNVTISAPQGAVVVAVEGQAAVKAMVK